MKEILLDFQDYDKTDTVFERTAARAIVKREDKYLVVYSKYGDCKFPGGGKEPGESLVETMVREVREETGYAVLKEQINVEPVFKIHEISKGEFEDLFIMDSYYYECQVEGEPQEQILDDYENEYDYKPAWLTLDEIKKMNAVAITNDRLRWVRRELLVTNKLIENMF